MKQERIFLFVRECQIFANALGETCPRMQLQRAVAGLAASVPPAETYAESLCVARILQEISQGLARHVHSTFHRQHGGTWDSCAFDDARIAGEAWVATRESPGAGVFVQSVHKFMDAFDAAHPVPTALKAAQLIERHFVEGISIPALARAVGAHPVRLRALFKERYGGTIREYRTQYRLDRAAEWLETSTLPVDEIAQQVGFGSRDHFYRAFVRAFGSTPATYRRQCAQGKS